jgi:osmotically-inducible protein OsmY
LRVNQAERASEVKDGWVTLKRDVDHQFQSDNVFDQVATLSGVTGITNQVKVVEVLQGQAVIPLSDGVTLIAT